jgi:hypothetical protein
MLVIKKMCHPRKIFKIKIEQSEILILKILSGIRAGSFPQIIAFHNRNPARPNFLFQSSLSSIADSTLSIAFP